MAPKRRPRQGTLEYEVVWLGEQIGQTIGNTIRLIAKIIRFIAKVILKAVRWLR